MTKTSTFFLCLLLCFVSTISFAQETLVNTDSTTQEKEVQKEIQPLIIEKTPEVGKHVMANMDASSMILSLLIVLTLIIISALVLKRFNLTQQSTNQLKVIASLSLGAKERVVVVQIGEQQLVLGVCPQQISLLKNLEKPLDIQLANPLPLSGNILSFLQKNSDKKNTESNATTNEVRK